MRNAVKEVMLKETQLKEETGVTSVHLIADFLAPQNIIDDPEEIERILFEAAKVANNTPLKVAIHKFPVQGVTGVILLAESHIAIHTWPEHDYISIDIFTCGKKTKPHRALEYLKATFAPRETKVREVIRGSG